MRREQAIKRSISILTALCALSFAAPAAAQPATGKASDPEHVRDLLTRGTEALSANKPEEARALLSEALRLRRSYDVAAALGQAELELGKYRDAAEHFEYAIREFPPGESRKLLKQLEDAFAATKAHVATLHLNVNQAGCEITVDGAAIGSSPLPGDVFVDPGRHTLGAHASTGSAVDRVLSVTAGKEYSVELSLNPKASAPVSNGESAANTVSIPPQQSSSISPKTIALIGGGALTAVLLGVGIAERVRASDADDDAAAVRNGVPGGCAPNSQSSACRELIDNLDRRNSANQVAIVSFAGAGLAAAATAAIWLLWDEPNSSAQRARSHTATRAWLKPKVRFDVAPQNASVSFVTAF